MKESDLQDHEQQTEKTASIIDQDEFFDASGNTNILIFVL